MGPESNEGTSGWTAKLQAVTRRELLPVALVLLAIVTDALNAPTLSFYLLLAAVPAIVVAGLAAVEEQLQPDAMPHRRVVAMLHVVTLLLVLAAAAAASAAARRGNGAAGGRLRADRVPGRVRRPGADRVAAGAPACSSHGSPAGRRDLVSAGLAGARGPRCRSAPLRRFRLAELVATLSLAADLGLGEPMEPSLQQT